MYVLHIQLTGCPKGHVIVFMYVHGCISESTNRSRDKDDIWRTDSLVILQNLLSFTTRCLFTCNTGRKQ